MDIIADVIKPDGFCGVFPDLIEAGVVVFESTAPKTARLLRFIRGLRPKNILTSV